MRYSVLGPVRAWRDEKELTLGPPQQRGVLAALLLRRGRPMTVGELVDALWGSDSPSGAVSVIRSYVSRLRKVLDLDSASGGGSSIMIPVAGSYALNLGQDALDLGGFEQLVAEAAQQRTAGDLPHCRSLLHAALDLWQGSPLAGIPGPLAETERSRLEERRLGVLERRLTVDLQLGLHREVVAELAALAREHPLREGLHESLMVALYRCGRQAEALEVYQRARRTLVDELGIEPGPALRDLHARLLDGDPALDAPHDSVDQLDAAAGPADASGVPALPAEATTAKGGEEAGTAKGSPSGAQEPGVPYDLCQLPATTEGFCGREDELADAVRYVAEAGSSAGGPDEARRGPRVLAISGQPGIGKTTLAVEAAKRLRETFPDAVLFLELRGHATPVEPAQALEWLLRALGVPVSRLPSTVEERSALLRALVRGKRVLLVLDNAADEPQIRPLLPVDPTAAVLVTSRRILVGLTDARHVSLDQLPQGGGLQLLSRIVGEERVSAEPEAASAIVDRCGHLPLALRIIGNRLAVRPRWSLHHMAGRLADEEDRLNVLAAGDLEIRAAFHLAYRQLAPEVRQVFRRLSLIAGTEFGVQLGSVVTGIPKAEAETAFEELTDSSLLHVGGQAGRYRLHDLLRLFARERLEAEESPDDVRRIEERMTRWLLIMATAAGVKQDVVLPAADPSPGSAGDRAPQEGGSDRGLVLVRMESSAAAYVWLEREREHWLAAARSAAELGLHLELVRFARAMHWYSDRVPRGVPWAELFASGAASARALGHADDEAVLLNFLGWAQLIPEGAAEAGLATHQQALALARRIGNVTEEAWALTYIAICLKMLDRPEEGLECAMQGVALFSGLDEPMGNYTSRSQVGQTLCAMERYDEAMDMFQEMLGLTEILGRVTAEQSTLLQAYTNHLMGRALAAQQRWPEAVDAQVRARKGLATAQGYRWVAALVAFHEGMARQHLGEPAAAGCLRDALDEFTNLGDLEWQSRARAALAELAGVAGPRYVACASTATPS
ncbi:AfsR/SARP family transcriptional regulator [Streptomyces sp. 7N604]|uniref:AfsR/SARP family transcriptional regulator n=1 Tax=Streptomyces sp. 7N604 TaxID=3457415 RepID=UPI003FD0B419